jgi:protein transport protein SEC24
MAAPQDGYPGQGYPPQDPYAQQSPVQPGFGGPTPPPPAGAHEAEGAKKKKRGYAAQAYDFGAGANSALGGQAQGGGQFPPPQAPAYGGYPQQPEPQPAYGAPQYGAQVGGPAPGAPAPGYGGGAPYVGGVGYQAPDAGYPGPGAPATGGVAGITQGMGQMGMGGAAQPAAQPQQAAARPTALNQLYPTDLLNQPFNVAELELPPPPIILPPNVSLVVNCVGNF